MNVAEKLARQIRRVAELRHRYAELGRDGEIGLAMIDMALERGCKAAGSDDVGAVIAAGLELESFQE